jgi:DnaK suppressor protein
VKQRAKFLDKIKEKLITRKAAMLEKINKPSHAELADGQILDSGDEASFAAMEKLQNSLQKNEISELKLIDDALERLGKGEYGFCLDCEEHISEQRLETFPYVARCIVCQEEQEGMK